MTLVMRLLGPIHISRDDQPIQMRGYQPLALLAYLLLTRQAHTRQHLVDLLFDRADDPRASLRWSLSELRRAIGGGYLLADRQEVAFNFDSDYWLDVPAFEAGQFELYRGDFLEGLRLREVFQFEDWVFFERERLRGHYQTTLAQHLAVLERQGDDAAVVETAHRLLRLDNLREEWYRASIQAYARLGQREAALSQFELCQQVLQAELGLEPGPETVTLIEAIQQGHFQPIRSTPDLSRQLIAGRFIIEDPLKNLQGQGGNLPPQPTPFIGREKELADIARRLKDPACRLLTLVGPGGIGKTRLAIQAAQTFIDRPPAEATFAHGILFVPLTPISSPSGIVSAMAEAANFTFYNNVPPQQQLLDYLREKEMLLALDNFEQLLTAPEEENAGGVNLIAEILAVAAAVKLLVTSREGLKMQEEWLYPLQGLDLPAGDRAEAEVALAEYSAIQLFVQSARRVQPSFSAAVEAEEMLRICRLVEGMPLGIELAAAWLRVLPCAKIAAEIEGSLDFLSSSVRNVPARHRSMRAVFEQSWQRLSETEQAVLRRLSVFRGGFRRKAAGAVAGASLPALAGLVDKSLISLTPGGRYHLHELLRQFSRDKLVEAPPEQTATRERHSAYFLAFLQERMAGLTGKQPKTVLDEIQAEVENVRAAWNWAVEQGQVVALDRALDSLYQFYWTRSHFQEGEEIFRQAAKWLQSETRKGQLSAVRNQEAGVSDQASKIANRLLARQGAFYTALGDFDLARDLLQNSLALARRWEAQAEITFCLNFLGLVALQQGDYVAADPLFRESLTISQTIGHHLGMAETLERLGTLTSIMGDYLTAQSYLQQGLDLLREIENRTEMASMLDNLGANAFDSGDYTASEQYYQECLALSKEIGNQFMIAQAVGGLGLVAWGRGGAKLSEARQLIEESLTICREIGHRFYVQVYLTLLGSISNSMSRYEEGQRYFQEALDLSKQIGPMYNVIQILAGLGEAALGLENLQAARRYLLEALETPGSIPDILGTMVSWTMLLKKESDLRSAGVVLPTEGVASFATEGVAADDTTRGIHPAAGRAASQEVPANPEQKKQAVEILSLVLDHSASRQIHKDKAASLLAELEAERPLEVVATAKTRAKSRTLDEVVADILQAA